MLTPQPVPQLGQQGIALRARQVIAAQAGRVEPAASRTAGHDQHAQATALRQQRRLGLHLVDAVDDHVDRLQAREQFGRVVGRDEVLHGLHLRRRVDGADALGHRVHLGATVSRTQRVDLPVGVALGDVIEVHQSQPADRAARQCLGRPGAHPADAHHHRVRGRKARLRRPTVQPRHAAEAAREISGRSGRLGRAGAVGHRRGA